MYLFSIPRHTCDSYQTIAAKSMISANWKTINKYFFCAFRACTWQEQKTAGSFAFRKHSGIYISMLSRAIGYDQWWQCGKRSNRHCTWAEEIPDARKKQRRSAGSNVTRYMQYTSLASKRRDKQPYLRYRCVRMALKRCRLSQFSGWRTARTPYSDNLRNN